jgi:chain length determinant protein EpsF
VVRELRLNESAELRAKWAQETAGAGTFETWLTEALDAKLDVKPSRESSVINVSFTSTDPKFSATLANAFVQAYLDTTLDLRVDPAKQYSTFFDTRSKELREAVEKAQAKLSAFQKEHGIVAIDERYDIENARLAELSTQLVTQQALSADSANRQAQARKAPNQLGEVINNPLVSSLRADLTRQEAKLEELNVRLGDAHPQVIEARANITELRHRLESETGRVSSSIGVNNTINQARESDMRNALSSQRALLMQIKQVRDQAMVLQRDVESAQRAYDVVTARFTQSSMESQTKQTNTALLAPATEPTRHSAPNLLLNTVLAIFVGAMFGIAFALVRELRDRRLRSVQDVAQVLGIPVLGNLPGPIRAPLLGKRRFVLPGQVLSRLPRPSQKAAGVGART